MCKPYAQCVCRARARRAKCVYMYVHVLCVFSVQYVQGVANYVLGVGVASCVCV